jgi:RNA polymerase primary sigma factor
MNKKKLTEKDIAFMQILMQDVVSLNSFTSEAEDTELGDLIPDDAPNVLEVAESESTRNFLEAKMKQWLSPREAMILLLRFGFKDNKPKTLHQIGQMFNLTRERIRQIEKQAIRKLKRKFEQANLKVEDI